MSVLELRDVHKSYRSHLSIRKHWVLRGLSLSIEPGEIFTGRSMPDTAAPGYG